MADFYEQVPIIIRELINRLNDENQEVLKAANSALNALSTHVPAEELVNHVEYMRNLIATMVSDARRRKGGVGDGEFLLPGFNMPKGKFQRSKWWSTLGGVRTILCCIPRPSIRATGAKTISLSDPKIIPRRLRLCYCTNEFSHYALLNCRSRSSIADLSTWYSIWCTIHSRSICCRVG